MGRALLAGDFGAALTRFRRCQSTRNPAIVESVIPIARSRSRVAESGAAPAGFALSRSPQSPRSLSPTWSPLLGCIEKGRSSIEFSVAELSSSMMLLAIDTRSTQG